MNFKRNTFVLILMFTLILSVSMVSASEDYDNLTVDTTDSIDSVTVYQENVNLVNDVSKLETSQEELKTTTDEDVIVVGTWDELQYYCAQTDKDYTLKLKENTNFYPSDDFDINQQIKIKNNVKIIGSEGSWIGDSSSNPKQLLFLAMVVEDNAKVSLTLDNVTFKWIFVGGSSQLPDGIFMRLGGKKASIIKNCKFHDIRTQFGHSCIIHLKKGTLTFDNCSFTNLTNGYGVLSVYDSISVKTTHMIVRNCYFENNYGSTEPGCINNCGKLTVYNTTFVKNRSFWWAGAIHTHSGANSTIYDSVFIDNVAGWNGGALYSYSYLQVYNSVFVGNNCTTDNGGGAIGACAYGSNPHIYIENCLFEDNSNNCWYSDSLSDGPGRGGAISIMDVGSLEVCDSIFVANVAAQGTAICAINAGSYGSPDVYIINNSFINHTRVGDVLKITTKNKIIEVNNNFYSGNSIEFSNLTLSKLSLGREHATLQVTATLSHPSYYDDDILDKTLYDVYINNKYVKTVNTTVFTVDFGDLDICDVYVIPTISNRKSNEVTITSTREYVFVSKNSGNDNNNGISRETPVNTIKRALELAQNCQNIILLDGDFSESNIQIDYGVTIKGEGNATLTGTTSFIDNSNFTLKNLKINKLSTENFINQNTDNLFISNCIFTDNDAVLVYNKGFASLTNSILINNSKIVDGNVNDCVLDYNWWGNVPSTLNNYVTLNLTSDVNALENNQKANVKAVFYLNDGSKYTKLPEINLDVVAVNGAVSQDNVNVGSGITYTLTAFDDGVLTVSYNNVNVTKSFEFLKSNPDISLSATDVMVGDSILVTVSAPSDAGGNLTCIIGNLSQTKAIQSKLTTFTFDNLKADTYAISLSYSGDMKYLSKDLTSSVNVNKYESVADLNISTVNVGDDVIVTVTVTDSATGNVTLSVNSNVQTLTLTNSKAQYTIEKIKRGDYLIRAVYNGDDKYLTSENSLFIEVDNLNASMTVEAEDITYGDKAIVKVNLNDDATGEVTVTIDGITNSSIVSNGKAEVSFTNLEAGSNKNITVFYSGDDTYFNLTKSGTFSIAKADLIFSISSGDIKIGQFAEITIVVPQKTSGTFTINGDIINIPLSGEITYVIGDLEIGNYTYTAVYNGNNYYTVSKSVSFEVTEYTAPQWANEGSNTENTHKSPYETETNGEVAFIIPFNETLSGDLAIDSKGNLYLTTQRGVYCFNQTNRLWYFTSDAAAGYLSGIAIGRDVIIAPKSGDTLYFINQTTGERFGESNIYQGSSLYAPVIDSNATLYIVSEYQFTSEDYKLTVIPYRLWEKGGDPTLVAIGNAEPICSPTVNENVIVVLSDNRLRLIDAKTLDTISIKQGNYLPVRPIIGEGNIVYTVLSDSIVAYNSNGVQVWKTKVTGGVGDRMVLDPEQGVYHVNARNILYRYDLIDGSQSKVSNLKVTSGILIGIDGTLYFGSNDVFYAMDSEGNVLWKSNLNSEIIGNPIMDKNGLIYVPTENGIAALIYAPLRDAINVTVNDIFVGETAQITIEADSQIVNPFTYTINGETFTGDAGTITKSLSDLKAGNYSVEISYDGDARFNSQNQVSTFEVKKLTPTLTASAENITVGETLEILIETDATGLVYTVVNGNNYTAENNRITIPNLKANTYTASIVYVGNDKYESIAKEVKFTVSKVSVSLDDALSISDDNTTFTVKLAGDATGNIKVSVDNVEYTKDLSGGLAEVVIPKLSEGPHNIKITYSGDDKYLESTKSIIINGENVTPEDNTTQPADNTTNTTQPEDNATNTSDTNQSVSVPDEAFTIPENGSDYSIILPSDATGTLTVTVDGKEYSQELVDGKATVSIPELAEGSHNITVTYSGDGKYLPISKTSVVVKDPVNSTDENATQPVPDEALTIPEDGSDYSISLPSDATGTLTVTVDGVSYTQTLVDGKATVSIPELAEGSHNITVTYSGDGKYASTSKSSVVVKEHVPVISLTASNLSMLYTSGKSFNIRLTSDGNALPNQKVKITINGKTYTRTTNVNGYASVKISLPPKAYTVKAAYGNLTVSKKVTVKSIITAKNVNAKKSAKTVKIKVTLKKVNGKYLKNKKVTLKFNKKTFKAKTNKKGVVTFTIKKNVYNKLKANKKYTYQVIYAKDKVKKAIKFKK